MMSHHLLRWHHSYPCLLYTSRRAKAGETLTTLDGNERELNESMLIIADTKGPIGVAGVMGGLTSEVTDKTTNVLFEAAVFNGPSIRRTSKALGMRSEASGRFERGVNHKYTAYAIDRAAQLLQQICPSCKVSVGVIDVYPEPVEQRTCLLYTSLWGVMRDTLHYKLGWRVVQSLY